MFRARVVRQNDEKKRTGWRIEVAERKIAWALLKVARFRASLLKTSHYLLFSPVGLSRRKLEAPSLFVGLGTFSAAVAHATAGAGIQTPVSTHRAKVTGWEARRLSSRCQVVGAVRGVIALGKKSEESEKVRTCAH